jgi:Regulator of chromosome condensation (RCC1) repeat
LDHSGVAQPSPKLISALVGTDAIQVSANDDHGLALGSGGKVYAWGNNFTGQLGDGTTRDHAALLYVSEQPRTDSFRSAKLSHPRLERPDPTQLRPGRPDGVRRHPGLPVTLTLCS